MSWRVPSTPNARSVRTHQSTTPAGPPPSYLTDKSTTPAGPPPRLAFGSSFNPSNDTFVRKTAFTVPYDDEDEDDAEFEVEEDAASPPRHAAFTSSLPVYSPRGLKRSHDGKVREDSGLAAIARGITAHSKTADLREADNVVLQSEGLVSNLDRRVQRQPTHVDTILTETAAQLTKLWAENGNSTTKQGSIGPKATDGFNKANYLASLLLQLHYPHSSKPNPVATSRFQRTIASGVAAQHAVPLPQALLGWLDAFHKPFPDEFDAVHLAQPAPAAHEAFWDVLYACVLRGKLAHARRLLVDAGWAYAASAVDDGNATPGYTGIQLQNTEEVTARGVALLDSCPALNASAPDWDVKGAEWALFRQRTRAALAELEAFAEGEDQARRASENVFSRSLRESNAAAGSSLLAASRRAESRVPWTVYENLKLLYSMLLGSVDEILMTSQDWLEGALYLTIWWDGSSEDDLSVGAPARSSLRRSVGASQRARDVDLTPTAAYRRRLAAAFARVTDNPEDAVFSVDTIDPVQVGLACILEDSVSSVLELLRVWSIPITVCVLEFAALDKWLPLVRPRSQRNLLDQGFSKEDLLVLSHGPSEPAPDQIDRDEILSQYANLLSSKETIADREGWELAVAVLNRLDQATEARQKVGELLDRLQLSEEVQVDKVLQVCSDLGLTEQRRIIAERYADSLAESTQLYGSALIYYARAGAAVKLRNTLALLTSMSLLHSAAMPTAGNLDTKLASLISSDRAAIQDLAKFDLDAATLLSSHLSGYATLRKFYELRDQGVPGASRSQSSMPQLRPMERQRQAAGALFNVIKSAVDCIPGGLYDPSAEAVVPVDGLLALFGETLPFLGQRTRVFTEQQVFALLGAAEDYAAAPSRIRENAASLLSASLTAYRESTSTATGVLRRNKSDLSVSSSWDMLASSTMLAQTQTKGSAKVQRAWDWRKGIVSMASAGKEGGEVLQLFREAVVKEVAKGWGNVLNW